MATLGIPHCCVNQCLSKSLTPSMESWCNQSPNAAMREKETIAHMKVLLALKCNHDDYRPKGYNFS